jgi:hypothetical protein
MDSNSNEILVRLGNSKTDQTIRKNINNFSFVRVHIMVDNRYL